MSPDMRATTGKGHASHGKSLARDKEPTEMALPKLWVLGRCSYSLPAQRRDGSNSGLIRQSGVAQRGPQAPGVSLAWK